MRVPSGLKRHAHRQDSHVPGESGVEFLARRQASHNLQFGIAVL